MNLINKATGKPPKVGDVLRNHYDGYYVTLAGWDPYTSLVHVWLNANRVGDVTRTTTFSAHFLGLDWVTAETCDCEQGQCCPICDPDMYSLARLK